MSASDTVRGRLWMWGHEAGSHDNGWKLPKPSRMTPAEGALYLGVPNLLMVTCGGRPEMPFDQYAMPFRAMEKVVWSITGASGQTSPEEREHVIELTQRFPNFTGLLTDDLFATICLKSMLHAFGGWGYDHIVTNVVPMMTDQGISEAVINRLLVDNPARLFT